MIKLYAQNVAAVAETGRVDVVEGADALTLTLTTAKSSRSLVLDRSAVRALRLALTRFERHQAVSNSPIMGVAGDVRLVVTARLHGLVLSLEGDSGVVALTFDRYGVRRLRLAVTHYGRHVSVPESGAR